jgi:intracellular septation protein
MNEILKIALELGPLAVFFVANATLGDVYWSTGLFMAATACALGVSVLLLKRQPSIMLLVSGTLVLVFGALTIFLHNDVFIKIKPTIVNLLFAAVLLVGVFTDRLFIKMLLGEALKLTELGWRKLQHRQGLFFIFLAILNEIVWRSFSFNFWTGFKLFGVLPLSMVFMALQIWLIRDQIIDRETVSDPQKVTE